LRKTLYTAPIEPVAADQILLILATCDQLGEHAAPCATRAFLRRPATVGARMAVRGDLTFDGTKFLKLSAKAFIAAMPRAQIVFHTRHVFLAALTRWLQWSASRISICLSTMRISFKIDPVVAVISAGVGVVVAAVVAAGVVAAVRLAAGVVAAVRLAASVVVAAIVAAGVIVAALVAAGVVVAALVAAGVVRIEAPLARVTRWAACFRLLAAGVGAGMSSPTAGARTCSCARASTSFWLAKILRLF